MQIYSDKLFENPIEIIEAEGNLSNAFARIEKLRNKYHLLGYVNYDFDYLYFEVFDKYRRYFPQSPKQLAIIAKPRITNAEYFNAIEKIKDYIFNGVTYEVNYTYPYDLYTNLDGLDLYEAILDRQKTPYNTFIKNEKMTLLSYSPELFFKIDGRKILTKPMKGTAPRGCTEDEDNENKTFLYNDVKNRAENIMIVDLLRNDLGRIAKTGTVNVDKLFDIEAHPTVFQMTSEISAELENNVTLYDVFKAIFPCGSITGAPKLSTMRVIDELEPYNRNIYCGAIGYLSPDDCEFSVPIRIIYGKDYNYTCHVGGAVVWDSRAEDEWLETLTKFKFLDTDFSLVETGIDSWDLHIKRMKNSAAELGFVWNDELENIDFSKSDCVTRIVLFKNGNFEIKRLPLSNYQTELLPPVKICGKVNSKNKFLYHKTTVRGTKSSNVFEEIRVNERGEITEGTFTNVAVEVNGKLYTPPSQCGLLNGIFRQQMIKDGLMEEKILFPADLKKADKIFCFNSVRKMFEVKLCS